MKRILLLSALVLLIDVPTGFAQSLRTVVGRVVNDDGNPVSGAVITVRNYPQTFKSDSDGNFSIKVPYGLNDISADYPDHISAVAEIDGSYLVLRLKYDSNGVKRRENAMLKAQQDSLAAAAAAEKLAEKERLAAEEQARKEAEAKARAQIKEEKRAVIASKDNAYNEHFKNKGLSHSIDFSYVYELSQGDPILYVYSGFRSYGNLHPMQLTYILSYKFNRLVSLGAGAGVLYNAKSITIVNDSFEYPNSHFEEQRLDVPVFLNLKLNFLRTKVRPFISLSGGYYLLSKTVMGEGGVGCEFRFAGHCGFQIQASASVVPWPWFTKNSPAQYVPIINPGLKVGFEF